MGHGPGDGNTIFLTGLYIAGGREPGDVSTACNLVAGIPAVGATQGEINKRAAPSGMRAA